MAAGAAAAGFLTRTAPWESSRQQARRGSSVGCRAWCKCWQGDLMQCLVLAAADVRWRGTKRTGLEGAKMQGLGKEGGWAAEATAKAKQSGCSGACAADQQAGSPHGGRGPNGGQARPFVCRATTLPAQRCTALQSPRGPARISSVRTAGGLPSPRSLDGEGVALLGGSRVPARRRAGGRRQPTGERPPSVCRCATSPAATPRPRAPAPHPPHMHMPPGRAHW